MSSSAITPVNIEITNNVPTNVPTITDGALSYVPSITATSNPTLGTTTVNIAYYRQVGSSMEVNYVLAQTTAGTTGSGTYKIGLPSGLTIDTSKLPGQKPIVGTATIFNGVDRAIFAVLVEDSSSVILSGLYDAGEGDWGSTFYPLNNANQFHRIEFTVPIAQWAGTGTTTLANRAVEEYSFNTSTSTTTGDTTSFGYGPGGFQIGAITALLSRQVQFQTTQTATDSYVLEISTDRITWQEPGSLFNGQIIDRFRYNGTSFIGAGVSVAGSTVSAIFGQYRTGNSDAWGSVANFYWRIRKVSGGAQVGYPVSARNIVGDTSGTAVPTGMIGETIEFTGSNVQSGTSNVGFACISNYTVPAGKWIIHGNCHLVKGTGSGITYLLAGINTSNSAPVNYNTTYGVNPTEIGLQTNSLIVDSNGSAQIFMRAQYDYSSLGTSLVVGRLQLIRIA